MHTLYEAEQQQRAFERKIRATKRTLAACDEALNNLSDEELLQKLEKNFSHYSSKLKRQESELNSFCKRTGLLPDGSRSQVYGFGRSTAQKAVWKNKKQKVDAAANSAIRNTGKVLEFNSKTSFRINIDGYDQAIIDGLSSASKRVAELGSKDDLEHLILVDLSNGAHSYLEVGNHLDLKYKNGIITAGERTRRREEIIVDGLLKKFTKGLIEIE